ncbi:filamentous hemagglutinin N-terminal domain-containing protein [Burkholderia pyrrocinia]|uniref:two-partner secretion domain-containing protein n=1 Tax=Burkholderia pyrrocinia TaxID=60550 RepID=UPI001589A676|nr:filamentous hemagglutinin N-terminal domain-containing protein [Burkholderia pyrrocinia]
MSTKYAVRIQASRLKPLAALIPLLIAVGHAGAVGVGQIAAGSGTISSNVATTGSNGATTINQQSNRLVVNWSNFDVATGERVQINQPNAQSAILNRVNSASRTQIDGALSANGRIFVVNPNGIVVGKTGTINANGVVLSTLDVPDSFFIKSEGGSGPTLLPFRKVAGAANAAVVNEGTINAGVAGVNLFGSQVINGATGKISAKGDRTVTAGALTSVNMVASDMVEAYQTDSTGGLVAYIPFGNLNAIAVDGLVANDGAIEVDAGNVDLNIYGGRSTLSEALRNTGSIKASSVDAEFPGVPGLHTIGGNVSLRSRGVGTHVGGSISGKNVTIATQNNTVVDGTLDAVANLDVSAVSVNKDATLGKR